VYQGKTCAVVDVAEAIAWIEKKRGQPKSMAWLARELRVKSIQPSVAAASPAEDAPEQPSARERFDPLNKNHVDLRRQLSIARVNEIRALKLRGALVPRDRLVRELAAFAHAFRQRIRSLPDVVSANLVNIPDKLEIAEKLRREIDEMLNDLAESPDLIAGPTAQEREDFDTGFDDLDAVPEELVPDDEDVDTDELDEDS
jgi:hypothetical protein